MNDFLEHEKYHTIHEWDEQLRGHYKGKRRFDKYHGLLAEDFINSKTIRIILEDGSECVFHHAFYIESEDFQAVVIFTEHCGYFSFAQPYQLSELKEKVDHADA